MLSGQAGQVRGCPRHLLQGLTHDALQEFEAAVAAGEAFPGLDLQRAMFLGYSGRVDEAVALMTPFDAEPCPPRWYGDACALLSTGLAQSERFAEAEEWMRRALALRPFRGDGWSILGVLQARQGRHAEAMESARRHLDLDPGSADARLVIAASLVALGQREEAAVSAAGAMAPTDAEELARHRGHRAVYAAALGDEEGVRSELEAALQGALADVRRRWLGSEPRLRVYRDRAWYARLFARDGAPDRP